MDQDNSMQRDRNDENLDSAMEHDTGIRRDTQVARHSAVREPDVERHERPR